MAFVTSSWELIGFPSSGTDEDNINGFLMGGGGSSEHSRGNVLSTHAWQVFLVFLPILNIHVDTFLPAVSNHPN